jgi:hypothetical protein
VLQLLRDELTDGGDNATLAFAAYGSVFWCDNLTGMGAATGRLAGRNRLQVGSSRLVPDKLGHVFIADAYCVVSPYEALKAPPVSQIGRLVSTGDARHTSPLPIGIVMNIKPKATESSNTTPISRIHPDGSAIVSNPG